MDFVINALGMPFNGETIQTKSLGGSESAAYYLARELVRRGHRVSMFTVTDKEGNYDGVLYNDAGKIDQDTPMGARFEYYARNTPHDVLIIQRHPLAFQKPFASKINIWQAHDLALHRTAQPIAAMTWNINAVTTVSEWHKEQLCSVYPIDRSVVHVVRNGVDPDLYNGPSQMTIDKADGKLHLLYQSRPERGLEHLVRPGGIMDRLREVAHLHVCGYDNTTEQMAPYYQQLAQWASLLPNVTMIGSLPKQALAQMQRSCDLLCYPTEFEEVSCITAMEAMHAGLPMVTSHHAALIETCRDSGTELIPLRDGKADEDAFVAWITMVFEDRKQATVIESTILDEMKAAQRQAALTRTWDAATDDLLLAVEHCFSQKSDTSLLRHQMKYSDFDAFRAALDVVTDNNAMISRLREEAELYNFLATPEAYKAHYDKWCGKYYEEVPRDERNQVPSGSRWQGVQMLMAQAQARLQKPLRVLDYGCAHGHYSIGLAKLMPESTFHGIDINAKSIQEAIGWAGRDKVSNVIFTRADTIADGVGGNRYDVVLLGEVLEHVANPMALLDEARAALTEGGMLLTTTPYGPWEWMTHDTFPVKREHVRLYERADLVEIFTDMQPEIVCAPAGHTIDGAAIGSWCCLVEPQDKPFRPIDMMRKLHETMPEQSVSACLIVKNGERTLRKTLDSLALWVAEVIIGIDPTTTDDTSDVIARFAAAHPWLPVRQIVGLKALEVGFGPARNHVVDQARGDWILWMDADEELIAGERLTKLLRPNMHDGYACPQIHYSIEPAQVLTTDYPTRLYRRNRGIVFHGLVHEHPEIEQGQGVPTATMRPDIQFAHNGYVTEGVRRDRYFRNLPLLMRDVQENPDRLLNKFLLIRDLAQGIGFELQSNGGRTTPAHRERAQRTIDIWRSLLDNEKPVSRMLLDAMQYYTLAAEVLGGWFDVDASIAVHKSSVESKVRVQGKFLTAADFNGLLTRLSKEATANYDSAHF